MLLKMASIQTWSNLYSAFVSMGLSLTVSYSQGESVLPFHQITNKKHCLVVRVIQDILEEKNRGHIPTVSFSGPD